LHDLYLNEYDYQQTVTVWDNLILRVPVDWQAQDSDR